MNLCIFAALLHSIGAAFTVEVTAQPHAIVLGGQGAQVARIDVRVRQPNGQLNRAARIVLFSTGGKIVGLTRMGPGHFSAQLQAPEKRFPQVVQVSAVEVLSNPPTVGTLGIVYAARIELKGQTEPGARMEIQVGSKRFGPVRAGVEGHFAIPIVVPAGVGEALGISTDKLGNRTRSKINLYLPQVRRVHAFVYPHLLVANGRDSGWLFVTTVDAKGLPKDTPVHLTAGRGEVGRALRAGRGITRRLYITPRGIGNGADHLRLRHRHGKTIAVDVPLMSGPPASMAVSIDPKPTPADGTTQTSATVFLRDAAGDPVEGQQVTIGPMEALETAAGTYVASLAPRNLGGKKTFQIVVQPKAQQCSRAWLRTVATGFQVYDIRGLPCEGELLLLEGTLAVGLGQLDDHGAVQSSVPIGHDAHFALRLLDGSQWPIELSEKTVFKDVPTGLMRIDWQIVGPITLRLELLERQIDSAKVRVYAQGNDEDINWGNRLRIMTTDGEAHMQALHDGGMIEIISCTQEAFNLAVTDGPTGVSAWLPIP